MSTAPPCGQTNSCWLFMQTRRFPSLQTPALQNVRLLCRMLLRSQELWTAPSWARALFRLVHWVRWKSQRNSLRGSQTNIAYHYDLSNEFYRLFLDETLTYSCAWFHNEETSLTEAQRAKLDYACQQLQLQPGQRVLDIGCGWGSFALHAATHYGVEVHGISLSRKQLQLAPERARSRSCPFPQNRRCRSLAKFAILIATRETRRAIRSTIQKVFLLSGYVWTDVDTRGFPAIVMA